MIYCFLIIWVSDRNFQLVALFFRHPDLKSFRFNISHAHAVSCCFVFLIHDFTCFSSPP